MNRHMTRLVLLLLAIVSVTLGACRGQRVSSSPTPRPLLTPVSTRTPLVFATATPSATPRPPAQPTPSVPPSPTPTTLPSPTATVTPAPVARVTARIALNVRAGPGTVYPVVTALPRGEEVTVLAQTEEGAWLEVRLPDGTTGWVSRAFTDFSGRVPVAAALPPTPAPAVRPTEVAEAERGPQAELSGKLVFQVAPGGPIYVINADGSGLRRVTEAGLDPTWSPDGSRIAFVDWRAPAGIYVVNADGTGLYRLFDGQLIRQPDWSPDGAWIAFSWQRGGRLKEEEKCFAFGPFFSFCFILPADPFWELALVSTKDGSLRELKSDPHSFSPSWNADGTELVFRGDNPFAGGGALRRKRVPTDADPQLLLADPRARDPRWCANGQIAFTYRQHDHWEIYVVNEDGSGLRRLTFNDPLSLAPPPDNAAPAWSPDCRHIAFLSNRDGVWRIYVMDADGQNQRPMFGDRLDHLGLTYTGYDDRVLDWAASAP